MEVHIGCAGASVRNAASGTARSPILIMPRKIQPSPEITAWTKRLDALLKECPPGHWLFAANGHLVILRYQRGRERTLTRDGGMDPKPFHTPRQF